MTAKASPILGSPFTDRLTSGVALPTQIGMLLEYTPASAEWRKMIYVHVNTHKRVCVCARVRVRLPVYTSMTSGRTHKEQNWVLQGPEVGLAGCQRCKTTDLWTTGRDYLFRI